MRFDLLVRNTSEVLTCQGHPTEPAERALASISRGAIGITDGKVAYLGPDTGSLDAEKVIDARGALVGPGFVDPHTHLVFAGDRSREFDLRNRGASYLEIAQAGGGIANTVRATREAAEELLVELARPRLQRLLEMGVTCAEVKTGYGLSVEHELKMLRAVKRLGQLQAVELLPTLLCAHAIPPEFASDRAGSVALCEKEILPACAAQARFFDIFVEQGAFTIDEAKQLFVAARAHGLIPRLHADQITCGGGAQLAADVGASSADHLENVSQEGIRALAEGGVSAVLVPVATLFLHQRPYASGRKLREGGVNVALGTNVNPGSAMSESVALTLGLACLENGLTPAEAYWGMTRGAGIALQHATAGKLEVDGPADVVVFNCREVGHLPYHLGINHVHTVLKAGRVVHSGASDLLLCDA
ncbi:MAG: imidazolonepropionase [Myxococcaceae bacterium]